MALNDWMTPYMPADARANIPRRTIFLAEKSWSALMVSFGCVNIAVALLCSSEVWVLYATFVPTAIIVVLFFVQYSVFQKIADRNAKLRGAIRFHHGRGLTRPPSCPRPRASSRSLTLAGRVAALARPWWLGP